MVDRHGDGPFANVTKDVGEGVCAVTIACSVSTLIFNHSFESKKQRSNVFIMSIAFIHCKNFSCLNLLW